MLFNRNHGKKMYSNNFWLKFDTFRKDRLSIDNVCSVLKIVWESGWSPVFTMHL